MSGHVPRSQWACRLATLIVRHQFGEIAEVVVSTLLSKGRLSLPELVRTSKLDAPLAKQALLALLQHNLVAAWLQPEETGVLGVRPAVALYEARLEAILQDTRKPRFLDLVRTEFEGGGQAEVAVQLVELLVEHGRMTMEQLVTATSQRAASPAARGGGGGDDEEEGGEGVSPEAPSRQRVASVLLSLVRERLLERVPPCTLPPPRAPPAPGAKAKTAKAPQPGSMEEQQQREEEAQRAQHAHYHASRFSVPREVYDAVTWGDPGSDAAAAATASAAAAKDDGSGGGARAGGRKRAMAGGAIDAKSAPAAKRRRDGSTAGVGAGTAGGGAASAAPTAAEGAAPPGPELLLWRINPDEFNRRFRHAVCVGLIAERLGKEHGTVVAAMLAAGRSSEATLQESASKAMALEEVEAAVEGEVAAGRSAPLEQEVETLLGQVHAAFPSALVMAEAPAGDTYSVDMSWLVVRVKTQQLQVYLRSRFGEHGLRIFNLLWARRQQMEQKQVGDAVMVEQRTAREALYNMMRAGYLGVQDIPRGADRAPSRCVFTWRVDISACFARFAGELLRMSGNILARLQHELDSERELLQRLTEAQEREALLHSFSDAESARLKHALHAKQLLLTSLLRLDEQVALFNEY